MCFLIKKNCVVPLKIDKVSLTQHEILTVNYVLNTCTCKVLHNG